MTYTIHEGDCLEVLPTIPDESIDFILTDPPYPCVERAYGYWSEADWLTLMKKVIPEAKRVLTPTGSAVFIIQPNGEIGSMRTWFFKFVLWAMTEWNMVQDCWWWNHAALPHAWCNRNVGLMRQSVKLCLWLGPRDCYRDQGQVLWEPSDTIKAAKFDARATRTGRPSGHGVDNNRVLEVVKERGGTTPFNLLPIANTNSTTSSATYGHPAGTPPRLCEWWCRYCCPQGGTVLDPFAGLSSVGEAAIKQGKRFIGMEKEAAYVEASKARLEEVITNMTVKV